VSVVIFDDRALATPKLFSMAEVRAVYLRTALAASFAT
jgi:hypothetical protein